MTKNIISRKRNKLFSRMTKNIISRTKIEFKVQIHCLTLAKTAFMTLQ